MNALGPARWEETSRSRAWALRECHRALRVRIRRQSGRVARAELQPSIWGPPCGASLPWWPDTGMRQAGRFPLERAGAGGAAAEVAPGGAVPDSPERLHRGPLTAVETHE
ncbi:hypothetical protein NDU88_005774 [Pleurodeles waltl]|uniref:Uncharacterized protein n=1 Tax=Pleurodeles waltl TaxID=8319 RepID=A0AAV7PJ04_PLEWA|nr:hypothetical protein NDU88_005774 [Pleurodeles waltl]